ncbi:MAG: Holliday junction resolvase RuvX [Rhodospirillales bacterium CG15_BIG_FIL_POST_REV_8_21_14_020_66_15]|nr:MAG: Holliday junction resolvase RuvX [Rhodospirillales bacterium CG15_BIG_FIL_POST_REV_8_21_14_020_66_15]
MAVMTLADLKAALDSRGRVLGLDLGTRTIGMALSDVGRTIATPYDTIRRTKFTADAAELLRIVDAEDVKGLVIGLPVSMDGSEGPRCQSTRQFAANLLERRDLPIAFWDERLSTAAIERMLVGDVDMTRARRGQVIDKLAAAYILQGALDAR